MDFRYDNSRDCNNALSYTVVMREDGEPVFLTPYDDWQWEVVPLGDEHEGETIDLREAGLTFEPIQLGYVNYWDKLIYIARRPKRMWKQGLNHDQLKAIRGYLPDELLQSENLRNTIVNDFPSMPAAYRVVRLNNKDFAFHRHMAFTVDNGDGVGLEYKGEHIGFVDEDMDFQINEKYFYLKEAIEEIINEKG